LIVSTKSAGCVHRGKSDSLRSLRQFVHVGTSGHAADSTDVDAPRGGTARFSASEFQEREDADALPGFGCEGTLILPGRRRQRTRQEAISVNLTATGVLGGRILPGCHAWIQATFLKLPAGNDFRIFLCFGAQLAV
jgi:hypothetical protein